MNKGLFLIIGLLFSVGISAQEFQFEKEVINYGKIEKNSNGERTFIFTNIGNKPLIIKNIQSTCGCTIPKKPEKPIMPGEKGEIKVAYNTKLIGRFTKQIVIFSNAKTKKKLLKIKGIVTNGISLEREKNMLIENNN